MTTDGFGEGDDEAQEVLAGIGVDEVAYVVGGLDSFGGGLEVERGSDCGDFLGLWDRSQDYCLCVVVRGKVNGRRTDWPVVWRWGYIGV